MKKIFLMSLILVGCNSGNNAAPVTNHYAAYQPPAVTKPAVQLSKDMDLTYGQKVRMTGGFYKGCTGKVVGFGREGTQQTFDIDLDKSCDGKQIYTYGVELVKKIK